MAGIERQSNTQSARWWAIIAAGLLHGVFMGLALPPVGLWPLALVAIIPLIWAGCNAGEHPKRAALLVTLGVLPFWIVQHLWLIDVTAPGMPVLCLYMALYAGVFAWIISLARGTGWKLPMAVVAPLAWIMLEVLRGEVIFTGYGFFHLAHPLIESPLLSAPGVIFGAYGVSLLCAALGGTVADAAGWTGVRRPTGGVCVLAVLILWAGLSITGQLSRGQPSPAHTSIRVGIVQTNLPQSNKMGWAVKDRLKDMQRFLELTRQAAAQRPSPDVLLWPETMFPGPALNADAVKRLADAGIGWRMKNDTGGGETRVSANEFHDTLVKIQSELGIPVLIGSIAVDGDIASDLTGDGPRTSKRYNSVLAVAAGKVQDDRYDKIELTPFGEMIPHLNRWPALQQAVLNLGATGMEFDLTPGEDVTPLRLDLNRTDAAPRVVLAAAPICFEGTRAALCRRLVIGNSANRASVLINFSNDGWFGWWDPGRAIHLLASRWRCVELGVPMVRAVNTGYSGVIDRRGQIITTQLLDRPKDAVRVDGVIVQSLDIDPERRPTPFELMGLVPSYVLAGLGAVMSAVVWYRRRRVLSGMI